MHNHRIACPDTRLYLANLVTFEHLRSRNARVNEVVADAEKLACSGEGVLIEGETGTGKGQLAMAMRNASPFVEGPWVEANCGGISMSVFESEWFGTEKGAFTGATTARRGLFREADGGILFLDEVGEVHLECQSAFLHAVHPGRVRPIGGSRDITVHVCVYSATNQDLAAMVRLGTFRKDLWMRLGRHKLCMPPLRERPEDLLPIFLSRYEQACARNRKTMEPLTPDLVARLEAYSWPGNLRELANIALDAAVLGLRHAIDTLSEEADVDAPRAAVAKAEDDHWKAAMRRHVWDVFCRSQSDYREASRRTGLGLSTVYRYVKEVKEERKAPGERA